MNDTTICLKQYLNQDDCSKIEELKKTCTNKEDMFLKLELEFKLNMSRIYKDDSLEYINEFMYYIGDLLVGYLGIFSFGGETGELTGMVHPHYRRNGIFKRLYSLALEECRRRNFKKILLVSDNRSSSGLKFIKASGASYAFSEYEMKLKDNYISEGAKDIVLRKATNNDVEEIERQNYIYFSDSGSLVPMPEDEEKRNRITYMIELDFRVIGKIRVDTSESEGFISGFGILPEYRGKGYGRQALKAALIILSKNNFHNAALEVAADNRNALNLYKSCGFMEESVMDYYEVK